MALFIDTADLDEIQEAMTWGVVSGVTTNPIVLAREGLKAAQNLAAIGQLCRGPIFYQLMATSMDTLLREAQQAQSILGDQLVLKLPPTPLGFQACAQLSPEISCCPTAMFTPAQALLAREAGAHYIAVYVNRAQRLIGSGYALVKDLRAVVEGSSTRVLAASLKTAEEASQAYLAGAHDLTLPMATLRAMWEDPHSQAAVDAFQTEGIGLDQAK